MRKTLFESFAHGPLTEAAPEPDAAGLAELGNVTVSTVTVRGTFLIKP